MAYSKLRPDLESAALPELDMTLFVDGSCYRDHEGNHAGYAVVNQIDTDLFEMVKAEKVPQPCSAQKAELKALTEACVLAARRTANVYTDSAYAHGVFHLFGAVWHQREFKKTDGSPIQHLTQITDLMTSMMLPKQLAVVRCHAHKKDSMNVTKGNNATDETGSTCAVLAPLITVQPHITLDNIADMKNRTPPNEKNLWEERGAMTDAHGLWHSHDGLLVIPVLLVSVLILDAHGLDHCTRGGLKEDKKARILVTVLASTCGHSIRLM